MLAVANRVQCKPRKGASLRSAFSAGHHILLHDRAIERSGHVVDSSILIDGHYQLWHGEGAGDIFRNPRIRKWLGCVDDIVGRRSCNRYHWLCLGSVELDLDRSPAKQ